MPGEAEIEWTQAADGSLEIRTSQLRITDARDGVDVDFVERMLRGSYWAAERTREAIETSIACSIPFSIFEGDRQVAFARVLTDRSTFAWIADVIVDPETRGRGLGKQLVQSLLVHPDVAPAQQKLLRTKDAHGLYAQYGFEDMDCMTRRD